ncbi:hypothetical protein [Nocardioides sp. InS609-2]|uniref:hypothetical protein n=1 Tax=Nocardioides sp. InS609-2 TaxID=2760705 RepID=UPI0020BDE213|nr:hypothetical protein [Nocardioides sp. InS609-2]
MTGVGRDDLDAFTGDAAGGEIMRRSLEAMAKDYAGTPLGDRVRDVLTGRLGIRELAEDSEFQAFTTRGMEAYDELWSSMSAEERAEAIKAGQAYEADLGRP